MKNVFPSSLLAAFAAGFIALPSLAESSKSENQTSWKITGDLEEACSCRPACPCWFKSKPSRMTCDGVQSVFIKKGSYGKTPLDGLAMAQFVQSPEGKSMFESFGSWNFDYVYIDERANDEQRAALKEVAAHLFPAAAKAREFRFVPIKRTIEGSEHNITVGSNGSFSGHLIGGGFSGSPKVANPPLADPTHKQYWQGETTKLTYTDAGQGWEYKDSNYMFNSFKVNGKQYAEYEAEMAKKMGAGK